MQLSDFSFDLPENLIAQVPLQTRSASRLMQLDGQTGQISHWEFSELATLLNPADLLVLNDTRVIPARLYGRKNSGGKVELLLERMLVPGQWLTRIRASKAPKPGTEITLPAGITAQVMGRDGEFFVVAMDSQLDMQQYLNEHGHIPLPPYIQRADTAQDNERYQTVYSRHPGAVAAPTAGLHFDEAVFAELDRRGIERASVTLHVGAGTFQPIREADPRQHQMHAEWVEVSPQVVETIARTRERGGRVIAVGTTTVRSLESAAISGDLCAFKGDSKLFITPGVGFRVVDAMVTNFHLPESTLLMLVAAFAGHQQIMQAYSNAIAHHYRFFSYGDAMLLWPDRSGWKSMSQRR